MLQVDICAELRVNHGLCRNCGETHWQITNQPALCQACQLYPDSKDSEPLTCAALRVKRGLCFNCGETHNLLTNQPALCRDCQLQPDPPTCIACAEIAA